MFKPSVEGVKVFRSFDSWTAVRSGAFAMGSVSGPLVAWGSEVSRTQSDIPSNKQILAGKFCDGKVRTLSTRKDHLCQRLN